MLGCGGGNCASAHGPVCRCRCGGSNHGGARILWAGALSNSAPDATERKRIEDAKIAQGTARERVEAQQRTVPERATRPRRKDASAFFEAARTVDLVNWLVEHPTEVTQINWMEDRVRDACERALEAHPRTHVRFADHFWCDVIASLLQVFDELIQEFESLPGAVAHQTTRWVARRTWDFVRESRRTSLGNDPTTRSTSKGFHQKSRLAEDIGAGLSEEILASVVQDVVTVLVQGALDGVHLTFDGIVLKLRILGLLLCPNPYAHAAVWNHCFVPLLGMGSVIVTKSYADRFLRLFNTFWHWPA